MSPFTGFLIFAAIVLLELWAAHAWLPFYYRYGLPVYRRRIPTGALNRDPRELTTASGASQGERVGRPSLAFHALPENSTDGTAPEVAVREIAIRERMFENRPGLKYLPVMHAVARLRPSGSVLTGYLNLSAAYALGFSIYRAAGDSSFVPVAILIAFVLAMSYVVQRGMFSQAAEQLTE